MYHPRVVDHRQAILEAQPTLRGIFPKGIPRLSVGDCQEWTAHLEKKNPRARKGRSGPALTKEEEQHIVAERLLAKIDFAYCAERYLVISLEARAVGPLYPLWESQRVLLGRLGAIESEIVFNQRFGGVFVNVLKARQLGFSTLAQALLCHRTVTHAHVHAVLASDVPDSSNFLFDMQERMIDHLPWWLCPTITERVKNDEIVYGTGSRVMWGAGKSTRGQSKEKGGQGRGAKGQLGRGKTVSIFHGSEISTWEEPEQIDDALLPAMPNTGLTLGIWESTAKGRYNYWHKHWLACRSGSHAFPFVNLFIPWYAEPSKYSRPAPVDWSPTSQTLAHAMRASLVGPRWLGHKVSLTRDQLYWYESMRSYYASKGRLQQFLEEYAADDDECFQHGGTSIFPFETIARIQEGVDARPPLAGLAVEPRKDFAQLRSVGGVH